jgi:hypothetical protein
MRLHNVLDTKVMERVWGSAVVKALRYYSEGSNPGRFTGDFFRGIRQIRVPGVELAFRNEYNDILGDKEDRSVGLTTLPT